MQKLRNEAAPSSHLETFINSRRTLYLCQLTVRYSFRDVKESVAWRVLHPHTKADTHTQSAAVPC